MEDFTRFGIKIPQILLPKNGADLKAWSVIACDQYTQDRDYWKNVETVATGKPSTLNITLPEVYLGDADKNARIEKIRKTMSEYLAGDVFADSAEEMVYIERKTAYGRTRKGLVAAIDLETYEWKPFSKALIRATEATIVERIPPRMEIRRGAPIETPHIMLLVNDPNFALVEKTGEIAKRASQNALYDTDLMANSGHITGWAVKSDDALKNLGVALEKIALSNTDTDGSVFMFAVGDGNHSLATAKAVWDEFKTKNGGVANNDGTVSIPRGLENHSARYALIEIVNIYDAGLTFEPIHRVIFGANKNALINFCAEKLGGKLSDCASEATLTEKVVASKADFGFVYKENGKQVYKLLATQITDLAVSRFQPALDEFLKTAGNAEIDYIHGTDEVFRLGAKDDAISVLLPPIAKDSFFATIAGNGPLPRKSFSMGEASEKRFYMECRKLF